MKFFSNGLILAMAATCSAFSSVSLRALKNHRPSFSPLRMVEKVDVDIVSSSSSTGEADAKTSEFVDAAKEVAMQLKNSISELTVDGVQSDFLAAIEGAKKNIKAGKIGERGEAITLIPYIILIFLIIDDIPIVGGLLEFLAGPGLVLVGLGLYASSILSLGKNLSPWPQPSDDNVLITTGVYSICRHPLYTGLVAFGLGLGFATDSFTRIALAGVLMYVLDKKSTEEENMLIAVHPAYKTYQEEVPKFFPLLDKISLPEFK